jgi:integrase/recombinase XerD
MRLSEVSREVIEKYQRYLYEYKKKDGSPLTFGTQRERLEVVRGYFHYLSKNHYIAYSPAGELEMPLVEKRLPKAILSVEEVEGVMNAVDMGSMLGIRDRAILEFFYCTGIRREELIKLSKEDVNWQRKIVLIRQGKWRKDRVVPISDRALKWLEKYIEEVRSYLVRNGDPGKLFVGKEGKGLKGDSLSQICRQALRRAGIKKRGACHIFRHTMATLMLEGGADIRYIQEMLGHEAIITTQVYTRVSIKKLQEVHEKTHPGSKGIEN